MNRTAATLPTLFLLTAAAAAFAGPPRATLDRLGEALVTLDGGRFVGAYTVTASSRVAKASGADAEETLEVRRVTHWADGSSSTEVLRSVDNGADVTADKRREAVRDGGKRQDHPRDGDASPAGDDDFRLPVGADATLFAFSPAQREGALLVASFAPVPAHRRDQGLTRGRIAWDPATLDPAWIEVDLARHPTGLQKMLVRIELARVGGVLFPRRTVTDVLAGLLWIRRQVHVEVRIDELAPAAQPGPAPAS